MYRVHKKWGVAKKTKINGVGYDSRFEARYAQELDLRQKANDIKSWSAHEPMDLIVNGFKVAVYKIDFVINHNDGTIEYVECKGLPDPTWRLKWKIFEAMMSDDPNVTLTVVQQKSNWKIPKPKRL